MEKKQPASFAHLAIALEGGVGGDEDEGGEEGEGKQKQNIRSVGTGGGEAWEKINKLKQTNKQNFKSSRHPGVLRVTVCVGVFEKGMGVLHAPLP